MGSKTKHWIILVALIMGSIWLTGEATAVHAFEQDLHQPVAEENGGDTLNCRYGIASIPSGASAWMSPFGAGWHLNYYTVRPNVEPSNGAEYVYTLRMQGGQFDPPLSSIDAQLSAYPGSLWLVGNEQEVYFPGGESGDNTLPQVYASAYHEAYNYIKQRDPSAQVGIGGMSMVTPARLDYLTQVWNKYLELFEEEMPVDVWNVHIYILHERQWDSTNPGHGQIALGTDPLLGIQGANGDSSRCSRDDVYCIAEHDSLDIFMEQTEAFRNWMKVHGQQNKPFMISEIAILYQPPGPNEVVDEFGDTFTPDRVKDFMAAVFDYLENAKNPSLGYPQDDNRLVQQWLWFSMYVTDGYTGRPSNLLVDNWSSYDVGDPNAITSVGDYFQSIVGTKSLDVNLKIVAAEGTPTAPGTADFLVEFLNNGNTSISQPFQITYFADADLTEEIASTTIDPVVYGCARSYYSGITLDNLAAGEHTIWIKVDGHNEVGESDETNNDNVTSVTLTITGMAAPHLTAQVQNPDALLNWTKIIFAPSYKLYRDATPYFSPGTPYQTPTTNSFPDPNVIANTETFYYIVSAVDESSTEGPYSNRVGVFHFVITPGVAPLGTPQISIQVDGNDALVTWPAASGATGYVIYTESLPYQPISPSGEPVAGLEFIDEGIVGLLPPVYYQATATNNSAESAASNEVGKFSFAITSGTN